MPDLLHDPLSAALADGVHQHRLHKAQDAAADALRLTVRDSLRAALRPLVPRLLALPILGTPKLLGELQEARSGRSIEEGTIWFGPYGEAPETTSAVICLRVGVHPANYRLLMNVPSVAERRYAKSAPHILLVESTEERYSKPRNDPAEAVYTYDSPPTEVIARFCAMLTKHVDFARVQA